ncbi:hypothetical protein BLOT_013733 [Blomia tropicalis]|nr:hypothetical protein BLOT_013733 [Blomia tropicalis]
MVDTTLSWEHFLMEGYWQKNGDPRVLHLPFMTSFRVPIIVLTCYILFVLVIGPRLMANRKPYSLKKVLLTYNTFMCLANGAFFIRILINYNETLKRLFDFNFPSFNDTSDWDMTIIFNNYLYLITKYIDLFDTIFFVLRKKQSQITPLHLYHHFSVAFFGWITFRFQAIANVVAPFAIMNTFIHVLMYGYYALAAMGPSMQPYLWWKRYITQLQIVQFLILFVHASIFLCIQRGYGLYFQFNYMFNTVIYIYLFTRFYIQTYRQQGQKKLQPFDQQQQQQQHSLMKPLNDINDGNNNNIKKID